jgi:hypothetical protein
LGGACLGAREILLKGGAVIANGSTFQEVRPEDNMAASLFYQDAHVNGWKDRQMDEWTGGWLAGWWMG